MKQKPNLCAYCREARLLTRDHIWPACFLERRKGWAGFTLAARKVHGGEQTVRDVCRACNNELLSPLDVYFCELDAKYLAKTYGFDETVEFEYDYHLLVRALLKISYNTARANGSDTPELRETASYILGKSNRPRKLEVVVELVRPIFVDRSAAGLTIPPKEVRPTTFRAARSRLETDYGQRLITRVVTVNSFFFHMIIGESSLLEEEFDQSVHRFSTEALPGSQLLSPSHQVITLKTSGQDGVRSHLPQLSVFRDQYREFFDKQKQKT